MTHARSKEPGLAERLGAVAQGIHWSDQTLREADECLRGVMGRILTARRAIRAALTGERVNAFALSDASALLATLTSGRSR